MATERALAMRLHCATMESGILQVGVVQYCRAVLRCLTFVKPGQPSPAWARKALPLLSKRLGPPVGFLAIRTQTRRLQRPPVLLRLMTTLLQLQHNAYTLTARSFQRPRKPFGGWRYHRGFFFLRHFHDSCCHTYALQPVCRANIEQRPADGWPTVRL